MILSAFGTQYANSSRYPTPDQCHDTLDGDKGIRNANGHTSVSMVRNRSLNLRKCIQAEPWRPKDPIRLFQGIEYDSSKYHLNNVVLKYCQIAGIERFQLKYAATLFLDESKDSPGHATETCPAAGSGSSPKGAKQLKSMAHGEVTDPMIGDTQNISPSQSRAKGSALPVDTADGPVAGSGNPA